jgi:26S proteasome regulatory subunit N2
VVYEDKMYPSGVRQLAALVASKVYYHLGSYEDALSYALVAGPLFDVTHGSQYVETIIAKCIDSYTSRRNEEWATIDNRLEDIVNRMFDRYTSIRRDEIKLNLVF